jgi:hypothetical protein
MYIKNIFKIIVFLIFFVFLKTSYANYDSLVQIGNKLIFQRDSIAKAIEKQKKETQIKKIEETFKFASYLNYVDRGTGVSIFGAEKYIQYEGKEINNIYIKIEEPFFCDSCSLKKGQKFGNKIHFNSKEWQAKQDLLFKTGDKVSASVFTDAERLLWERNRYKYVNISIAPACDENLNNINEKVDVYVYLVDRLSYTMATGYSSESLVFMTNVSNFFGMPNVLSLRFNFNFNKNNLFSFGTNFTYRNILNSKIDFSTSYNYSFLSQNFITMLSKNFLSLKTKWAFNINYSFNNSKISLTNNLRDVSSFVKAKSNRYSLWAAYAIPLKKLTGIKTEKLKFLIATKINHTQHSERPFIIDKNYNTSFINTTNFIVGLGFSYWEYYTFKNVYYIDQPEFLPKKWNLSIWIGPQLDEVAGRRNNFSLNLNYGKEFKKFGYLYTDFSYNGYLKEKRAEQMLVSINQNYITKSIKIRKNGFFRTLFGARFNYGFFYPEDRYFNINNAIRSFYSPSLRGSKSITANIETNFFLDKKIALAKGMVYTFADVGWISSNDKKLITQSFFQYGVGFGIRLRSLDLGLPFIDLQFAFYPKGKDVGVQPFQFRLYEQNINTILTNSLFFESPRKPNIINQ